MNCNRFWFRCAVCGAITAISVAEIGSHFYHGREFLRLDPHSHSSEQPVTYGGFPSVVGVTISTATALSVGSS